jgi:hypothetical protein
LPINLGNIQNLNIGGGLNGYVLTTDGSGNLSWQGSGVVTYAVANVSQANPAVVTTTEDNAILTGLQVTIFGVGGMTQLKTAGASGTNKFYVVKQSNSTFTLYSDSTLLSAVNSSAFTAAVPNTGNAVTSFYENGTGNPGGGNRNIQFNDGSGLFGGIGTFTFDKTTSNLSLTGNANITYDIAANNFIGKFTGPIGNTTANTGNFTTINAASTISTSGNVSAGGNVVVTGNISTGSNLTTAGNLSVTGNTKLTGKLSMGGNIVGNLVPDADITYNLGSPTRRWKDLYISSNSLVIGNGTLSTSPTGDFNFSNSNITTLNANLGNLATANFLGGTLIASSSSQPNISTVGNLTSLNVAGISNLGPVNNVFIGNSTANYVLTATDANGTMRWLPTQYIETPAKGSNQSVQFNVGNVISGSANFLFDKDFNKLTVPNLVVGTTINGNATISVTGNITGNAINATTLNVSGAVIASNTVSAAGNLTSNGILTVNNNAAITGNLSLTGTITANLTNAGNVSVSGNTTTSRLSVVSNVVANGNITGGNILTLGSISAGGNVDANNLNAAGNVIITGQANAVRFVASAEIKAGQYIQAAGKAYIGEDVLANGNVSGANILTLGNVSAGGNLTIAANAQINGNATITGTIAGGNITTLGLISARGNINGANITANGFITTTGDVTANGAISANGNITSLGTITANALNVGNVSTTGNLTVNNLAVANFVSSSLLPNADISLALGGPTKRWSTLYVGNTINIGDKTIVSDANGIGFGAALFNQANANIANLRTAYANLPDTGNIKIPGGTLGAILKTDGNGNISWGAPSSFVSGAAGSNTQVQFNDANIMAGSANFVFNKTSNTLTVDKIIANGSGLTGMNGANVTGTVSSASVAGTVSVNAQPNINSVGNLTGLVVGNLGNVDFSNTTAVTLNSNSLRVPNGWTPGMSIIAVSPTANSNADAGKLSWGYSSLLQNGNSNVVVDTAANIRFTANGVVNVVTIANTGLFTSNLTVNAIANLGSVSNVKITGGGPNQILRTDGNGVLSWVAPASTSALANANSNITVEAANINLSANGTPNVLQVTATGVNISNETISGTSNIGTLNINAIANLGAVANIRIGGSNVGWLLQSNGAGGVVWTPPASTSGLTNGNSSVSVDQNGNIRITANTAPNVVVIANTGLFTSNISATGTLTTNGIAVLNNGNITLPGTASTAGKIYWPGTAACSAPQLTTYSGGTRLVLQDSIATSGSAGYTMGIESGNMWFGTDVVAAGFKWYGGITQIATLSNATGFSTVGNVAGININTTGNVSATGNANIGNNVNTVNVNATGSIIAANITANTVISTTGNINSGNENVTGNVQAGNLRTTGNVSATGNITTANFFVGNGYYLTGVLREPTALIANGTLSNVSIPAANGSISVVANNVSVMTITSVGANISGNASISGNANVGNLGTAGNVTANYFIGNGALLTGIATSNQLFNGNSNVTIDSNANVRITANGSANIVSYIGNGVYPANANIGAIQPQNTYYRVGNVYVSSGGDYGHFSTHAWYTGGMWMGDGAVGGLFQIAGPTFNWFKGSACTSVTYTSLMSLDANGNLFANGTISSVSNITGVNIIGTNISATANVTGGNIITAGAVSATGVISTAGNIVSNSYHFLNSYAGATEGGQIVMSFAGGNAYANAVASTWNIDVGPANDFRIFNYNSGGAVSIPFIIRQSNNQADFTGNIATGANVNAGNVNTTAAVSAGGNITTTQFLNAGSMSVSGTINGGANANIAGNLNLTGNANVIGKINVSNSISMANGSLNIINWGTAGYAPPSIVAAYGNGTKIVLFDSKTSTATALGYTMGIDTSTFYFTSDVNFKWYTNGSLTPVATMTPTGFSVTGTVNASNFVGNGSGLTGISASNALSLVNGSSNVVVDVNGAIRIGAIGVPNVLTITNTGTVVTGTESVTGAITANGAITTATTLTAANLSITGNVAFTAANVSLGSNTAVRITGGGPNQFLKTDGNGNLSWVSAGGTANVAGAPTQVQFNTGGAMDASANFTFDKTTNTLVVTNATNSGNLSVGGNATVAANLSVTTGNISASGNVSLIGNNVTGKLVFNNNGVAAPILNGVSNGTRTIFYNSAGAQATNFAMGIDSSTLWYSVPDTASFHRWYGGTTQLAYLTGIGFSVTGNIFASANISTIGNILAAGLLSVTGTISSTGAIATPSTISATGNINTTATLNAAALSVTGAAIYGGVINTTSTMSATGTVTAGGFITAGTISANGTITSNTAINTTGTISATGNITTAGYIQAAGLASSGNMAIPAGNSLLMGTNAGTSAKIIWDAAGTGAPTYSAFSPGTKLVLYPATAAPYTPSASEVGYAMGIEAYSIWYSTSNSTVGFHRWYAGNTQIANLNYQSFTVAGNLSAVGNVYSNNENVTSNVQAGNLRTTGVVSAASTITGGNLVTGGTISSYGIATLGNVVVPTGGTISAIGNIIGGNIVANATVTGVTLSASGNVTGFNLTTGGVVSAASNVTGGNILTGGLISAAGSVTGISLVGNLYTVRNGGIYWPSDTSGDVATITYLRSGADTGTLELSVQNDTDDIIRLNASGGTSVVGNLTVGANITTTANANVGNLNATSNVQAGNLRTTGLISATGNVTASNFITTGTITLGGVISATGTPAAIAATGTINTLSTISATGTITGGNIVTAGAVSATGIISTTANITTAANISATAGIFASTISAVGNINSTGNIITNGTICTIGLIVSAGASANFASPIYATSLISTTATVTSAVLSATGNVNAANVISTGNVNAGTNISATGNITSAANISTSGNIIAAGTMSSTGLATHGSLSVVGSSTHTGAINTTNAISAVGTVTAGGFSTTGNTITGNLSVTGNVIGTLTVPGTANIGTANVTTLNVSGAANVSPSSVVRDPANAAINIPVGYRINPLIPVTMASGTIASVLYDNNATQKIFYVTGATVATGVINWEGSGSFERFALGSVITIINDSSGTVQASGSYAGCNFRRAQTGATTNTINVGPNGYAVFTKIVSVGPGGYPLWFVSGNF